MDKDEFDDAIRRIMERFDQQDGMLERLLSKNENINILEGERLLDNQDICRLLNVSKRTLQRYRSSGELPYQNIYHKIYYKESDVNTFINTHFDKGEEPEGEISSGTDDMDIP